MSTSNQNQEQIYIDLEDINLDDEFMSEQVAEISKDLDFIKNDKSANASDLAKKHNELIEKNYANQIYDNPFDSLNAKQMQAIDLLLKGDNKANICRTLDISRNTLNHWLKSENFLSVMESTKKDIEQANRAYFKNLVPKAINRLENMLDDPETGSRELLGAIKLVLNGAAITNQTDQTFNNNQTQIIINHVKPAQQREINNDVIDVSIKKKED